MDIRSILRVHRYSEIEQRPNPRTGERRVPPSIKFGVFLLALAVVGGIFLIAQRSGSGLDDGTSQEADETGGPNNTTGNATPPAAYYSPSERSPQTTSAEIFRRAFL